MGFNVVAIDISDAQLENARSLGADMVCNSLTERDDYVEKIKERTGGGCHAVVVFSAALMAYKNAPQVLRCVFCCVIVNLLSLHRCTFPPSLLLSRQNHECLLMKKTD